MEGRTRQAGREKGRRWPRLPTSGLLGPGAKAALGGAERCPPPSAPQSTWAENEDKGPAPRCAQISPAGSWWEGGPSPPCSRPQAVGQDSLRTLASHGCFAAVGNLELSTLAQKPACKGWGFRNKTKNQGTELNQPASHIHVVWSSP